MSARVALLVSGSKGFKHVGVMGVLIVVEKEGAVVVGMLPQSALCCTRP
ncbi:MAG: hypothetical protein MUF54_18675 [Polyangiaceae bacterium]|jgi:hypothetical protein|nr:hypothetical protein [Polyangiaceae bacterium]